MELREFRGYIKGKLEYTFPWHWVESIRPVGKGMLVTYDDETQYNTETEEIAYTEIYVDYIDVK